MRILRLENTERNTYSTIHLSSIEAKKAQSSAISSTPFEDDGKGYVQGDHSGCVKPPVATKTKVGF